MPDVAFDRFYRYDELTEILQGWAEERPELFRVESIGKSYEGRDIWLATVTNFETGADLDKPAFLVEANIHALEVTGLHRGAPPPRQAARAATGATRRSRAASTRASSTSCRG